MPQYAMNSARSRRTVAMVRSRRASFSALVVFLLLQACHVLPNNVPSLATDENRRLVVAFYEQALVQRQPRAAFERYVSPDFVDHKPDIPGGGREAAAAFLERLIQRFPDPRWEVVRSVAEGDLVVLHVRFLPSPGEGEYAIVDIFRVRDGRLVEHWDVVGEPVLHPRNPNARF